MLYGKLGIDFFSIFELFYPIMTIRLRSIRARPNFYMTSDNPNVSLGIVDCSLYTHSIAFRMIITKREWTCSLMDMQLFGDFVKDISHIYETKSILSRKHLQQCSQSSSRDCNEHKLWLRWFFYWKPILVSTTWSQTKYITQRGTANCRFWYFWQLWSICDYHESNELPGWFSFNPHWWFQRSLCAGVWLDFNARRYWKLLLSWTCWRTAEAGAKFYISSRRRYWTHCFGTTNVFGCSWQVWCSSKRILNWIMVLSSKHSTVSHYSSIAVTVFQFFPMRLLPL